MGTENRNLGLNNHARSPSSIANAEHHDASRSQKGMKGIPGTLDTITNDAVEHAIEDSAVLRVANSTGGTIFLWVGAAGTNPTVDATNGVAILAGTSEVVFCGVSQSNVGLAYKLSGAAQVVKFKQK